MSAEASWALEELGISGPQNVREVLTANPANLETDIEDFQTANSVLLPSLQPAMFLLHQHGVQRTDFNKSVLEELRNMLIKQVETLAAAGSAQDIETLKNLLDKSFSVHMVPHLRPVVLAVLEHLPVVDQKYLVQIIRDDQLFNDVAISVKQQIWTTMPGLFSEAVKPLFAQFLIERESQLFGAENAASVFFNNVPKTRRQSETVVKLVQMIGKSVQLFQFVGTFLKVLFMNTGNPLYSMLQVEILMSFHGIEHNPICSSVPVHKFAWTLDTCIREHGINESLVRELQTFMEALRKGQDKVLGDMAVALSDPHATYMLMNQVMKELHHCINNDLLPRNHDNLQLFFRLVNIGVAAVEMNRSSNLKEPKIDPHLYTKFLPSVIGLMVDDQTRMVSAKIPDTAVCPPELPSDLYAIHIKASPLASLVAMQYVLQLAKHKDMAALVVMLPTLLHCENDRPYEDCYLHSLISALIACGDDFGTHDFASAVFDDFLMPMVASDKIKRHVLRLLYHVHHHLPKEKVDSILEAVAQEGPPLSKKEKSKHSKEKSLCPELEEEGKRMKMAVVKTLELVKHRIETYNPNAPKVLLSPQPIRSPIRSVLVPPSTPSLMEKPHRAEPYKPDV